MISVKVFPEELTFLLENIPREIATALTAKMESLIEELRLGAFTGIPGKYLAKEQMDSGVSTQGSLVIGYLEYTDKEGVYPILPVNGKVLYSKERNFFAHAVFRHPYPRGANWIETYLEMKKPWVEAELTATAEGMDL